MARFSHRCSDRGIVLLATSISSADAKQPAGTDGLGHSVADVRYCRANVFAQPSAGSSIVTGRMRLAATGLVIVIVAALALNRNFYNQSAADLFFSITLASTSIVFLSVRPLVEALHVLVAATLLVLLQLAAVRMLPRITPALALWGVASLALLAWR